MHRASPYAPYALKYISSFNSIVYLENVFAGECINACSFPSSPNKDYLIQINDWAKAKHTKLRSQTCGKPAVSFSSEHLLDLLEDEGPQRRHFFTLCWATSAGHIFGIFIKSNVTPHSMKAWPSIVSQNIADYPMMRSRIAGSEMLWPYLH